MLFTGDSISSILNIVSTAIIINAIGMEQNGIILMIQTYVLFFDQIFNFKVFEALIKYLTKSIHDGDSKSCKKYIKQAVYLDLSTAIISTIIGVLSVNIGISIMGWGHDIKPYIIIYMCSTIFNISGVAIGIIRTYNCFNYISYINVTINFLKIGAFVLGIILKLQFQYYFLIELVLTIIKNTLLIVVAYRILMKNKLHDFYKEKIKFDKEFFLFNLNTNLASTIDLPINTLTTFIMNKYLGFEIISIYKIFEKIGTMIGKFSGPLNQIIYPELNLLVVKNKQKEAIKLSKKLAVGISSIGIVVLILIAITYKFWLGILIPNYNMYIYSLYIYILYIIFTNATSVIHSLFIALGYVKFVVRILICINTVYIIIIIPIVYIWGLNGMIIALLLQAMAVVSIKIIIMCKNEKILNDRICLEKC